MHRVDAHARALMYARASTTLDKDAPSTIVWRRRRRRGVTPAPAAAAVTVVRKKRNALFIPLSGAPRPARRPNTTVLHHPSPPRPALPPLWHRTAGRGVRGAVAVCACVCARTRARVCTSSVRCYASAGPRARSLARSLARRTSSAAPTGAPRRAAPRRAALEGVYNTFSFACDVLLCSLTPGGGAWPAAALLNLTCGDE